MAISREEVLHVAKLARLDADRRRGRALPRAALARSSRRSAKVSELDLAGRAPDLAPARARERAGRGRARTRRSRSRRRFANAPDREDGFFGVPPTYDRDRHAPPDRRGRDRAASSAASVSAAELQPPTATRSPSATTSCTATSARRRADGDGVPIALKDVISTKGIETTAGSKILEGYVPVFDATVAARCEARRPADARQDEHRRVRDGLVDRELGVRPVAQPVGSRRACPGGSGGGSAAAVSAGLAPWALGSDTGGSIKQPSSLCGNVGLRPTYGTVSRYGIVAFASSLDQVGPVAKNVRDCALLYSIIARPRPEPTRRRSTCRAVELPEGDEPEGPARRRPEAS